MPDPAPSPRLQGAELQTLWDRLARASKRAAVELDAGLPGRQPGETLRQYLAAEAEMISISRELRKHLHAEEPSEEEGSPSAVCGWAVTLNGRQGR